MISQFKAITFAIIGLVLIWFGWRTYGYFFDISKPNFQAYGIESDAYYSGNVECKLVGHDAYKVDKISIFLDNKPLVSDFRINKKNFEYSFEIPTKTLSNDQHELKIEIRDGSYNQNSCTETIKFNVDNTPLQAAFTSSNNNFKVFQGKTLHIQFQANKKVKNANIKLTSSSYPFYPEMENSNVYECFVPIDCEENPNEYVYNIEVEDFVGNKNNLEGKIQILPYPFKKTTLAISSEKLNEEKEIGKPQQELENMIEQVTKKSPNKKLWNGSFYVPIEMTRTSCDYGTIRTTQHKGCYMHKALDVIGAPKSVVWAPQDGVVVIKDRFVQSGNTVVIDHGCGILTLLFHLDNFADINVGDKVKRGNPVGTIGKTGYATGYHLHWEMRINNVQVDPMQWTKVNF